MASIIKCPDRPLPYFVHWRERVMKAQRSKAFATAREAEAFRDTVSTEVRHGTYTDRRPVPFQTFAEDWLVRTTPAVRENTHATHEWAVRKYLIPAFGLTPIQNLTAELIQRWQADLLGRAAKIETEVAGIKAKHDADRASLAAAVEKGTIGKKVAQKDVAAITMREKAEKKALRAKGKPGPRSVEICKTTLGTILEDARKKGRIFLNPLENVCRFDVPKRELHYLNAAQVKELCEQVGHVYGVLFLVMAFCGLRIGEVLGLEWPDLDLTRRRLFVQRQVIWRRKRG
jgi:integrase